MKPKLTEWNFYKLRIFVWKSRRNWEADTNSLTHKPLLQQAIYIRATVIILSYLLRFYAIFVRRAAMEKEETTAHTHKISQMLRVKHLCLIFSLFTTINGRKKRSKSEIGKKEKYTDWQGTKNRVFPFSVLFCSQYLLDWLCGGKKVRAKVEHSFSFSFWTWRQQFSLTFLPNFFFLLSSWVIFQSMQGFFLSLDIKLHWSYGQTQSPA